ncbi:MAG: riboflavin synthase [Desulfatiglans sp.]|jgi:riboflavin synthase|nr:riboflavin synthase [Desulfatiglans sp.]
MFTGLIEGTGRINDSRISGGDMDLLIMPFFDMSDSKIGDSVAVNGVCLTVTEMNEGLIRMYASSETTSKTTIGSLKRGAEVNLERAMKLTDRLGGHFVSGHVDGIGIISEKRQIKKSWLMGVKIDEGLSRYTIRKGSVAIDGISLTINVCQTGYFEVNIIPETGASTTLIKKRPGDMVNIETDLIAKYVERLLLKERAAENRNGASTINMEMLEQFGFGSNIK